METNVEIIENGVLVVGKPDASNQNNHVKMVRVYTGNDDYQETGSFDVTTRGYDLVLATRDRTGEAPHGSKNRIRGEVAVEIFLEREGGKMHRVTIEHHKGCILVEAYEVQSSDYPHVPTDYPIEKT